MRSGRHLKAKCLSVAAAKINSINWMSAAILVDIRHRILGVTLHGTISDLGRVGRVAHTSSLAMIRIGLEGVQADLASDLVQIVA